MILIFAAIMFALGALGGLVMAVKSFSGRPIHVVFAAGHGILGGAGLVLLIVGVLTGSGGGMTRAALVILVTAALGGLYLLSYHFRKAQHPRAVILVHALVALTGILTLLAAILQNSST